MTTSTPSGAEAVCPETRVRAPDVLAWPRVGVRTLDFPDGHPGIGPRYDGEAVGSVLARYYDPQTAQFLSVDPKVASTLSPYGYVQGDPLSATDPSGLFFEDLGMATPGSIEYAQSFMDPCAGLPSSAPGCSPLINWGDVGLLALGLFSDGEACPLEEAAGADVGGADLATTPGGRILSSHYLSQTGPIRNIPGSVVDNTIEYGEVAQELPDRTVYYDPSNNVTVVVSKTTGKIMSARRGTP